MSKLSKGHFRDEPAAFAYLEETLWPDGAVCPHCGSIGRATKLQGKATRIGVWKCNEKECRKQFTVKVGTVFEHGRMPLHKMLQAVYLLCCSKKGCSSHQLHRILGITYKSAWFLSHRIREAMRDGSLTPMGGSGKAVESDETYIGKAEGHELAKDHKIIILTLVERGGGARSLHIDVTTLGRIVRANIDRESYLMTDEAMHYCNIGKEFAAHGSVVHSAYEYGRGPIHTNTVEGFYSIFKSSRHRGRVRINI